MFNEKWRQRFRKAGRVLFYVLIVAYLLAVLDDLNSIQSDILSLEIALSDIQSDVSSIQGDVSSIEGNMPTGAHTAQHQRPRAAVRSQHKTISF